jgi:hypothetical protein
MRLNRALILILLGAFSASADSHVVAMHCDAPPKPITTVAPKLPAILHNEYDGFALVRITISKSGLVLAPRIVTEKWTPTGHRGTKPIGYAQAILHAIAQWKYPPQKFACSTVQRNTITNQ